MLVEPTGEVFLLDRHLARLGRSAKALGFVFPKGAIGRSIAAQAAAVPEGAESVILRLLLHKRGEFRIHATPLSQRPVPPTLTVRLATRPVDSNELFLRHKTTYRRVYEEALAEARDGSAEEVNDVLLFNERGELTEGTITNIVLQFGEKLFTPAAESGLLPGCYRESVLAAGRVTEAVLRVEDVHRCDAIWAVNSVRGMMPCRLTCQQAC
jgi:para-aminobenzoate synthetase/4-amino-4-deoxychorismate lyase